MSAPTETTAGTKPESMPTDTEHSADDLDVEFTCGAAFDPETTCGDDAIVVSIRRQAGRCFDHLPAQRVMPLLALGHFTDYYWNGVGPY